MKGLNNRQSDSSPSTRAPPRPFQRQFSGNSHKTVVDQNNMSPAAPLDPNGAHRMQSENGTQGVKSHPANPSLLWPPSDKPMRNTSTGKSMSDRPHDRCVETGFSQNDVYSFPFEPANHSRKQMSQGSDAISFTGPPSHDESPLQSAPGTWNFNAMSYSLNSMPDPLKPGSGRSPASEKYYRNQGACTEHHNAYPHGEQVKLQSSLYSGNLSRQYSETQSSMSSHRRHTEGPGGCRPCTDEATDPNDYDDDDWVDPNSVEKKHKRYDRIAERMSYPSRGYQSWGYN